MSPSMEPDASVPEPAEPAEPDRPSTDEPTARSAHDRLLDRCTVGALAALVVPLVVTLVNLGGTHWYPTGDMAQAELHLRGFMSHPPLVGAAGRIGSILVPYGQGSHPGPAMWFAMFPIYALFGRTSLGLMVSVTVVQLAFILLTVWLVRRLAGPLAGLAVATAAAVLVHSLGVSAFVEPWNPWLAIFAYFACLAAAWGVILGRHRWLWLVAGCGTFAVQCHAGYIPMVGVLLAGLGGLVLWRWRRDRTPGYARSWWSAVAILVAMWIPPLIDQWRREPGNLRILFRHFTSTTEADGAPRHYVGLTGAIKAFAGEFSVTGPWVRGSFRHPFQPPNWLTFLLAVAVVAIALQVLRGVAPARRRELVALFALVGVQIVVGLAATARIFGEFYSYVVRWWWVLVVWAAVACALTYLSRVRNTRAAGGALLAAAALASVFATINAAQAEIPWPGDSQAVGGLTPQVEPHLDRDARYLVRWYDPASLGGVPFGVILELERDGYHPGVGPLSSAAALPHRVLQIDQADAVLWIVAGERAIGDFRADPAATEVGYYDRLSADERAQANEVRAQLEARLTEIGKACLIPTIENQYGLAPLVIGGVDVPPDVRTLASEYNTLGMPVAAFLVPTDEPEYVGEQRGCS